MIDEFTKATSFESKRTLARLLKEQKRRRGMEDLHFLCKNILGYKDLTPEDEFHGEYCRHLERKRKFKLTLTPRGTLKSSIGTIGFPIKQIINNPNIRILIGSEKFSNSCAYLTEIKGHFEKNQLFRNLYGDLVGDVWSKHEIIVKTRTNWKASPTIACAGIDVTKVGMHYDGIIIDDPHSDQNTTNQDQIDKVIRWYGLLLSLLDPPDGWLNINGTIWHYNDLYNHIQYKERERLEKGRKPRFAIFKRDSFEGTTQELIEDKIPIEKFLWPERLSPDFLRDTLIEQGPYIFSCQYRLNPIDDETAIFKRSWLKTCLPEAIPKNLNVYTTIDPMRDEEGKDFLAIDTVGVDDRWRHYILDIRRVKADEHETVEQMLDVYRIWKPKSMGFETVAFQKIYLKYIKLLQLMKGYRLPIVQLKTDTRITKKMRIKSMVPFFKAGLFYFPGESIETLSGGMATLVDELTRYPKVASDDTIDALAYMSQLTKCPSILQIVKRLHPQSFKAIAASIKKPKKATLGSLNIGRRSHAG